MRTLGIVIAIFGALILGHSLFIDPFDPFEPSETVSGISLLLLRAFNGDFELLQDVEAAIGSFIFVAGVMVVFIMPGLTNCAYCSASIRPLAYLCKKCEETFFPGNKIPPRELPIPPMYWEMQTYVFKHHGESFLNEGAVDALILKVIACNPGLHPLSAIIKYHSLFLQIEDSLPDHLKQEFHTAIEERRKAHIDKQI